MNGRPAALGDKLDPERDIVTVDGKRLDAVKKHIYLMLSKPRGFITTMRDERGRRCVAELVRDVGARVYPVGRLDRESEGLLLLTNDGDLANALMHPSGRVPKTYRVSLRPAPTQEQQAALKNGIELDGRKTLPAEVRLLRPCEGGAVLEMTIREGRNRQIRRMCEALGLQVARLCRIKLGPLSLGRLKPGTIRELTGAEVRALYSACGRDGRRSSSIDKPAGL